MKRPSPPPLQFLAALSTETSSMSSRPSYRGGRSQWNRSYSDRPYNAGGRAQEQFVTGDSHFRSIRDANLGFCQGGRVPDRGFTPRYNQNQQFRQPPPPRHQTFDQNQNQQFRQGRPFDQNQNQAFRPRPPKPLDYRSWEYAKTAPPPDAERFVVLSYNILADYLAINHRSKLYYHVPRYMMDWQWRKRNIIFELGLWSPDIMCFQEVDRFRDLEEELKLKGYHGIWKMRAGTAVDGCAVFWRISRFKLLYEEAIEFNKLGLRDNVAQICVLELRGKKNAANTYAPLTSSPGPNKVVICNIHVLYNPKRGDIKLGQVRILLERAHAVSKMWGGAPVVLCGDFNCTPKSPLYNFICEQKLDLSGLDRHKLSGQASAEIRSLRPYDHNHDLNLRTPNNLIHAPSIAEQKPVDFRSEIGEQNNLDKSMENISSINDEPQPKCSRMMPDASGVLFAAEQCESVDNTPYIEVTNETEEYVVDSCKGDVVPGVSVSVDSSKENAAAFCDDSVFPGDQLNEETCEVPPGDQLNAASSASHSEDAFSEGKMMEHRGKEDSCSSSSQLNTNVLSATENFENLQISFKVSPPGSSEGDNQLEDASSEKLNDFFPEDGRIGEEQSTHLSAPHDNTETLQHDFNNSPTVFASDLDDTQLHSPSNEVLDDSSLGMDDEAFDVEKTTYDPSLWTPMEIATATGNADCNFLEHPLKLRSAYTEVQDGSGKRDSNGEPSATSYNRCFLGTVDYIWCSEGVQTVRVLAPIPKQVMQWTPGFPTKKWGSDHIALASELAFTKDASDSKIEVR